MSTDDRVKYYLAGLGVVCITAVEMMMLYKGIDGQVASIVVGGICTIIGYAFGVVKSQKT